MVVALLYCANPTQRALRTSDNPLTQSPMGIYICVGWGYPSLCEFTIGKQRKVMGGG